MIPNLKPYPAYKHSGVDLKWSEDCGHLEKGELYPVRGEANGTKSKAEIQ